MSCIVDSSIHVMEAVVQILVIKIESGTGGLLQKIEQLKCRPR